MTSLHKGIVLAGGRGTRLGDLTRVTSKQLLPVYDRPMVHYPLATLDAAGIRDVLVISTPEHLPLYRRLLGDRTGSGASLSYATQPEPDGIARALNIAATFLDASPCVLALGDNLFLDDVSFLPPALARHRGATVFTHRVDDTSDYGTVALAPDGTVLSITEKPDTPGPGHAVTGLYVLDATAPDRAAQLTPSPRGELEITDLLRSYLDTGDLHATPLPTTTTWFDAGTPDSLLAAANHVAASR